MDTSNNDDFKKLKDFIARSKREKVNAVRSNQIADRKEFNDLLAREVSLLRAKLGNKIGLSFEGVIAKRAQQKLDEIEANKYRFPAYDPLAAKKKNHQ